MTKIFNKTDTKDTIKKWCIAITGAIATGKSEVAKILRKTGYEVIDADQLARDLAQPGSEIFCKLIDTFGKSIEGPQGDIDRRKLLELILKDAKAKKTLETIMHPAIQKQFENLVSDKNLGQGELFFYEASLIFELGRENLFKECWATYCSEETQIKRLSSRSQMNRDQCLSIIRTQLPAQTKAARATHAIDTECSLSELTEKVAQLLKKHGS